MSLLLSIFIVRVLQMICSTVLSVMVILASGVEMFVSSIAGYDLVIKR